MRGVFYYPIRRQRSSPRLANKAGVMTKAVGRFDATAPDDPVSHLGRLHVLATAVQDVSIHGYRQCASRLSHCQSHCAFQSRFSTEVSDSGALRLGSMASAVRPVKGKPHHCGGALRTLWRCWDGDDVFLVVLHRVFKIARLLSRTCDRAHGWL